MVAEDSIRIRLTSIIFAVTTGFVCGIFPAYEHVALRRSNSTFLPCPSSTLATNPWYGTIRGLACDTKPALVLVALDAIGGSRAEAVMLVL